MLNFLRYLLSAVILTAITLSAAWLVLDKAAGFRLYSVQSDSMSPVLRKGDLVLDARAQPSRLKPGDVISYSSPINPSLVITHRIVRVDSAGGSVVTKGDNALAADAPVADKSITGRTIKVIPNLGYLLDAVRRPAGLILIVYLPAVMIGVAEIWLVAGAYGYRPYQLI